MSESKEETDTPRLINFRETRKKASLLLEDKDFLLAINNLEPTTPEQFEAQQRAATDYLCRQGDHVWLGQWDANEVFCVNCKVIRSRQDAAG